MSVIIDVISSFKERDYLLSEAITMPSGIRIVVINEFPDAEFVEMINIKNNNKKFSFIFLTTIYFLIFLSIIFIFVLSTLDKKNVNMVVNHTPK